MFKYTDLYGQKFGRLTVLELHHTEQKYDSHGKKDGLKYFYLCKCDCGNEKIIARNDLRFGNVNSCGCLKSELSIQRATTHGLGKHRLYKIYHNMLNRCNNSNVKCYNNYGGRGIKVCNEWQENFLNFYNWAVNNGYDDSLSIDRINVNGNYEPSNCQWVTLKKQASNKRNNHLLEYNGKTLTLAEWSRITGIQAATIRRRVNNLKWSAKKALTTKV